MNSTPDSKKVGLKFASKEKLNSVPFASKVGYSGGNLPQSFDLSAKLPPVGDQGLQNSCVGWAVAYGLKSYEERVEEKWDLANNGNPNYDHIFSPAYIYNQINGGVDKGSIFPDAFDTLETKGVATLTQMPYSDSNFTNQPSSSVIENAKKYKIKNWFQVRPSDISGIKTFLAIGTPVVIGMEVYQNFFSLGNQVLNSMSGDLAGGHALLIVGYDDSKNVFKVLNSWGTNWGDKGYFWIDYNFFTQVVREAYVAYDDENGTVPTPITPPPTPIIPIPPTPVTPIPPSPITPPPTPQPIINPVVAVNPTSGQNGTLFTFTGNYFTPNTNLNI